MVTYYYQTYSVSGNFQRGVGLTWVSVTHADFSKNWNFSRTTIDKLTARHNGTTVKNSSQANWISGVEHRAPG